MITFVFGHSFIYCLILHTHGFKARFQQQEERLDDQKGTPRVRPLPRHGAFVPGVSTQNVNSIEPAAM